MHMKKGFTRSDLIMSVICMLVLLVGFNAVGTTGRERAKVILCQSNLKQLQLALNKYLADNTEMFPDSYYWLYNRMGDRRSMNVGAYYCRWHNELLNLEHFPQDAGWLWPYLENPDIMICPTFNRLATTGWGPYHYRHVPWVPVEPQYCYSMNGYLGPGRFGIIRKSLLVSADPGKVMTFTEENTWATPGRDAPTAVLGNNNFVARISPSPRSDDPEDYPPERYSGGIATYHNALSRSLELDAEGNVLLKPGETYPSWDLCRGAGNAVFLDGHVELVPYTQDAFEISWPLSLGQAYHK